MGPDDEIPWGAAGHEQKRVVRFAWLRTLLHQAQEPDEAVKAKGAPAKPEDPEDKPDQDKLDQDKPEEIATTSQLLKDAQARLTEDLAQADAGAAAAAAHAQERAVLTQVLSGREFRNLKNADQGPSTAERLTNWLYRAFEWIGRQHARAAWIGRTLFWGFLTLVGVGLAWGLLQMERRWRIRLLPKTTGLRPVRLRRATGNCGSKMRARRRHAGQWREAIHFLYWAAISRLESKRLWPADRARTPREYLALVAAGRSAQAGPGRADAGALSGPGTAGGRRTSRIIGARRSRPTQLIRGA